MNARRGPNRYIISRDTVSFGLGWYLMIYQAQFALTFNATAFFGGMVAAGIPGALQVIGLWLGARTPPPPSEPLPSASSPGSSS